MCYIILILSILCPPLGLVGGLYGLYKDFKKWNIYIFCIALALASVAYCYIPTGETDIVRYIAYIKSLQPYTLTEAVNNGVKGEENLYVFSFFCWMASKLNDPHIIPALSTFFVYYLGFYVTCRVGYDLELKPVIVISYILFLIFSLSLYSIINNVRNVLAFTIISFATFRDVYLKKKNFFTIFLYVFPLFLHQSALVMILLRLILYFTGKLKIIMLIGAVNVITVINIVYNNIFSVVSNNVVVSLLRNLTVKAYRYFDDTSSEWGLTVQRSTSLQTEKWLQISFTVLVCAMIYFISIRSFKEKNNYFEECYSISDYTFLLGLLTIACAPMLTPGYWRFYSVTALFSAPVYFILSNTSNYKLKVFSKSIFLLTPLFFIIWIRFISNSDLKALILNPFISSPLFVIISDVLKLIA